MAERCKKCYMLKMTPNTPCLCNVKKFDDKKLSKHTKKEKAPTPVKQISDKRKKRLATNGTEGALFKKIFKNLEKMQKNVCSVCGTRVDQDDVTPACFPHILAKGLFPAYRYFENNIGFVCSITCHNKFDEAVQNFKDDKGQQELERLIKNGKTPDLTEYINF